MIVVTYEIWNGRHGYVQWREDYCGDGMWVVVAEAADQ